MLARTGAEIHHVIRRADRLLVVLHHDDGVAEIAQAVQRAEQRAIVPLVQADGRLVEHVQHARQVRSDLRGEPDALAFAAGERRRAASERQVPDADLVEEAQAILHFPQDALRDDPLAIGQLDPVEYVERLAVTGRLT